MVLSKFSDFDDRKKEKYRVLILSNQPDESELFHTTRRFVDEAKKQKMDSYVLFVESGKIVGDKAYNDDDPNGFEISSKDTVAFIRHQDGHRDSHMDMVSQLEKLGIPCVNSRNTIAMCGDKYWSSLRLADTGVPTPKTSLLQSEELLDKSLEIVGDEYPLILKTLRGSRGIGVIFIESKRQLISIIQLIWKQNPDSEVLLQSYIKTDFDVRVIMLNNKPVATMKRSIVEGDFRSNYSQGAKVSKYDLSEEEKLICVKADKAVGGMWTAVDFIPYKDQIFVLEVNSSPGTIGIEKATGQNLIKNILEHFKDKRFRWRSPTICGVWETFEHNKLGKLVGKMDTGNSVKSSVIHADSYEIKGNEIVWQFNDVSMKSKIISMSSIDSDKDERPLIALDFIFNGTLYKDLLFTIDDRGPIPPRKAAGWGVRTPMLMNRKFMNDVNLAVNPSRKFILTERIKGINKREE